MNIKRRHFLALFGSLAATAGNRALQAQEPALREPVHRVANAAASLEPTPVHPLDRALDIARSGLNGCRANINDYTAVLVKRERIDDVIGAHEFMAVKVRNRMLMVSLVSTNLAITLATTRLIIVASFLRMTSANNEHNPRSRPHCGDQRPSTHSSKRLCSRKVIVGSKNSQATG